MKAGHLMVMGLIGSMVSSTIALGSQQRDIEQSTFQDWSAYTQQLQLSDGSVLSEYFARTYASVQANGRLLVSFVPRFQCAPIISFVVNSKVISDSASTPEITLEIDNRTFLYPALVDQAELDGPIRFSFNGPSEQQRKLLKLLDFGSRVKVVFNVLRSATINPVNSALPSEISVDFSLLGSKKSAQAAADACADHDPIPFEAN